MITFQDTYTICQEISGLSDVSTTTKFKRDINTGGAMFLARLGRPYNRTSKFSNMVAAQQYYQYPEDALRISKIKVNSGTRWYNLQEVGDENTWININLNQQTSQIPTHYFVKGFDEVGIYPTPSSAVTDGIELIYEPKHVLLTQDDYTAGSITANNANQTITGLGTTFTASMVGRYLEVTDGTDGNWYRILTYTSATSITLENFFQGLSGSTKTYRIGEVMKLPEEYQESPADYAMYRHFLRRGEQAKASEFKSLFEGALEMAKESYGKSSGNQIILASRNTNNYLSGLYAVPFSIGPNGF